MTYAFQEKFVLRYRLWVLGLSSFLAACASRPQASDYVRAESHAISPRTDSTLRREFAPALMAHPGLSGFRLLVSGDDAFLTRLAMVRLAEHSLDLQYYAIHDDATGNLMLEELWRAADRGVRVRMLVDGMNMSKIDEIAAAMDRHPNIEVRAFNPVSVRQEPIWAQLTNYVTDMERYTKRMHNKLLAADNQVGVIGGRNIGDAYFDSSDEFNFSDLDIMVVGPVMPRLSRGFDKYWNSDHAYPLESVESRATPEQLAEIQKKLLENHEQFLGTPHGEAIRKLDAQTQLRDHQKLIWAPMQLAVDDPEKVELPEGVVDSPPMEKLETVVEKAQKEFIAVAPYLVPKKEGTQWMKSLVDRGVRVRVLTNSLASTDVVAVQTAYNRYREEMIKNGVELYEFKPIGGKRSKQALMGSSSRSSLHAKVYVIDRRYIVIGSFNWDPRSIALNTEQTAIIDSPEAAKKIVELFEESTAPDSSYQLKQQDGTLVWVTEKDGSTVTLTSEPDAGLWRHTLYLLIYPLAVESQL